MGLGVRTDVRTDSHVTAKIFEIDGLPNFLRNGAPRRSSAIKGILHSLMIGTDFTRNNDVPFFSTVDRK